MSRKDEKSGDKAVPPIWRTVKLGMFKNAEGARSALKTVGCYIGDCDNVLLLNRIDYSSVEREVNIVVRSVAELGFAKGATLAQVCEAARKLGLSLCPAEVVPALREQYHDQPLNERLLIAIESVTGSDGDLDVFSVEHNKSGLWIISISP